MRLTKPKAVIVKEEPNEVKLIAMTVATNVFPYKALLIGPLACSCEV